MKLLTSFVITFIEALSLLGKKELLLKLLTGNGELQVRFVGIVHLNISNDLLDMDDDEVSVVDISHEFRELKSNDLEHYLFEMDKSRVKSNVFHIVKIHGNTAIEVICEDVVVEKS